MSVIVSVVAQQPEKLIAISKTGLVFEIVDDKQIQLNGNINIPLSSFIFEDKDNNKIENVDELINSGCFIKKEDNTILLIKPSSEVTIPIKEALDNEMIINELRNLIPAKAEPEKSEKSENWAEIVDSSETIEISSCWNHGKTNEIIKKLEKDNSQSSSDENPRRIRTIYLRDVIKYVKNNSESGIHKEIINLVSRIKSMAKAATFPNRRECRHKDLCSNVFCAYIHSEEENKLFDQIKKFHKIFEQDNIPVSEIGIFLSQIHNRFYYNENRCEHLESMICSLSTENEITELATYLVALFYCPDPHCEVKRHIEKMCVLINCPNHKERSNSNDCDGSNFSKFHLVQVKQKNGKADFPIIAKAKFIFGEPAYLMCYYNDYPVLDICAEKILNDGVRYCEYPLQIHKDEPVLIGLTNQDA